MLHSKPSRLAPPQAAKVEAKEEEDEKIGKCIVPQLDHCDCACSSGSRIMCTAAPVEFEDLSSEEEARVYPLIRSGLLFSNGMGCYCQSAL